MSATNPDLDRVHANARELLSKTNTAISKSFKEGRIKSKIALDDFNGVLGIFNNPYINIGKSDEVLNAVKSKIAEISIDRDFEYIE